MAWPRTALEASFTVHLFFLHAAFMSLRLKFEENLQVLESVSSESGIFKQLFEKG